MRLDLRPFRIDPERTASQLRLDGMVMVLLGLILLCGGIFLVLAGFDSPHLYQLVGWAFPGTRFEQPDPATAPFGFSKSAVLAGSALNLFGMFVVCEGVHRIVLGKRNSTFTRMLFIMFLVFIHGAWLVAIFSGEKVWMPRY